MSGLHREPCAWQENAMPIPAPAFHSCCNSHKRLLKPKKNKTVILIKQHSGTLKTRWRLLRPTLKLYSLFQELHFVCAGRMDTGRPTPMGWGISAGKGQEAVLQHSSHPVPKYRGNPPSPGSQGPLLKASLDIFSPNPAFFSRCPESLTPWSRNRLCLFEGKSSCKGTAFHAEVFPSFFVCGVQQKPWDFVHQPPSK